jgi:hypothetical protein
MISLRLCCCLFLALPALALARAADDAARYTKAIAKINDDHARQPGRTRENELRAKLPADARSALQRVLAEKNAADAAPALVQCGEAALDLDLMDDFAAIRARLDTVAPAEVKKLGTTLSRPRFILRGIGELQPGYLEQFADVLDTVLAGYDEVFGFAEFSKVPGKKLRVRIHLEPQITKPPHFGPEFPWHSEIDFPVVDPAVFRSPTERGQFLFYGLCHELGHVIAMWGDLQNMEDHHAWAHYTGVVIVEHLRDQMKSKPALANIGDVRWRSLTLERANAALQVPPSTKSYESTMALLIALHDAAGPKAIGAAINQLDAAGKSRRINRVRYYTFAELRRALAATLTDATQRRAVDDLLN